MGDLYKTTIDSETIYILVENDKFIIHSIDLLQLQGRHGALFGHVSDLEGRLKAYGGDGRFELVRMAPGHYHPRIWRGGRYSILQTPTPSQAGVEREWITNKRINRLLFARLSELFTYVEPIQAHDDVSGLQHREILIMACTEVESAWKSVLRANNYQGPQGRSEQYWKTTDFVKLNQAMKLAEWSVAMTAFPTYPAVCPFGHWTPQAATQSLGWYDAYNAVKHDREMNLTKANTKFVIEAIAAVFILTIAQFGPDPDKAVGPIHPDLFHVVTFPDWSGPDEKYVGPLNNISPCPFPGFEKWAPRPYPF